MKVHNRLDNPEVWVSYWWVVISCHVAGQPVTKLQMRSLTLYLPCDCMMRIAIAVNCLMMESRMNLVLGVLGEPCSRSARP